MAPDRTSVVDQAPVGHARVPSRTSLGQRCSSRSPGADARSTELPSMTQRDLLSSPSDSRPEDALRLEVELEPRIHLAAQLNSVPTLRSVAVVNPGAQAIEDLDLRFRIDPEFVEPWSVRIARIEAGGRQELDAERVDPTFSLSRLMAQSERQAGQLHVELVRDDVQLCARRYPVEVLAPTEWAGASLLPELIAAFVLPNHAALQPTLEHAVDLLRSHFDQSAGLSGYQSRDPQYVYAMVQAMYQAMQASGVRYANPPASFEEVGQRIRTPDQVLTGLGTCLDLTVVMAALLEQVGLHALIVVIDGHAFPGCWLHDFMLQDPTIDDPTLISKRIRIGEVVVFDSSAIAQGIDFATARANAERMLQNTEDFRFAVDVARARVHRIRPISFELPTEHRHVELASGTSTSAAPFQPLEYSDPGVSRTTGSTKVIETAEMRRARWKNRLLDLSLRNRLLNFKEGNRTVLFRFLDLPALEDRLTDAERFVIAPRLEPFGDDDPRSEKVHESRLREDVHKELAREDQAKGVLHSTATPEALEKGLVELFRSARSAREETGVTTLYLGIGLLRWFESASSTEPRRAPIFMIPVELVRLEAGRGYALVKADEESRINVTLLEKLSADFGIDASGFDALPEDDSGHDVQRILVDFARLVADQPRWDLEDLCCLAEFSFAKFLMWQDLDGRIDDLKDNPVFAHILEGRRDTYPLAKPLVEEAQLDDARSASELLTVVDADPSQLQAILAAEDGSSFVLQGPPGTGKSQTITNLIAQMIGQGKSVLFVSEKMAALDVVHGRLEAAGLGAFCLELHSNKANKRSVLKQLAASFHGAQRASPVDWVSTSAQLEQTRRSLNDFARLIGAPTSFGPTIQGGLSELIGLRDAPRIEFEIDGPSTIEAAQFDQWLALIDVLVRRCKNAGGSPATGSWRACGATEWSEAWERAGKKALAAFLSATKTARDAYETAREGLGIEDAAACAARVAKVRDLAHGLLQSTAPPRALVEAGKSQRVPERLEEWSQWVRVRRAQAELSSRVFAESVLGLPLDELITRLRRWAGAFVLVRFFALSGVRSRLKSHLAQGRLPGPRQLIELLEAAVQVNQHDHRLQAALPEASVLLGSIWRGPDTDLGQASDTVARTAQFRRRALELSDELGNASLFEHWCSLLTERHDVVEPGSPRGKSLASFVEAVDRATSARTELEQALVLDGELAFGDDPSLDDMIEYAETLAFDIAELRAHCLVRKAECEVRDAGFAPLCDALDAGDIDVGDLVPAFCRGFYTAWWEELVQREPRLRDFQGAEHSAVIEKFKILDAACLELARREVALRLAQRAPAPDAPGDEMGLLRAQFQKKRAHMPIRKMFSKIPGILRRLKPCLLMSPLSVAQYLDPSIEKFDVVIFDEASQIPPWDAVGAIARGHQVIVVGDTKQLPPTNFFNKSNRDDEDEAYDEHDIEDLESILNESLASGISELSLKWHYRSRHESLIAFSNHKYYQGELRTFPSAAQQVPELGVELRPVPDGYYDRGASRTNRAEAEAVLEEAVSILDRHRGQKSVGVVTFSQAQQSLLLDLVDRLLQTRKDLVDRFNGSSDEHVFIKNLENVQGDERDVILFSVCYGPDRTGKVTMNFGPLNRDGGERRLNVAITRARERLVVFSTLRADQIDTARTRAVGAHHLRTFLDYAERGIVAIDAEMTFEGRGPESPFESEVLTALRERGHKVVPQVGVSGYRIDLAVEYPERPGSFALAIECDGASYHGSLYARERDRLRQSVLEGLGWRVYRIWSTDWWYDRPGQIAKLLVAVHEAISTPPDTIAPRPVPTGLPTTEGKNATHDDSDIRARLQGSATTISAVEGERRYRTPEIGIKGSPEAFYRVSTRPELARTLMQLLRDHGPLERDQAFRWVAGAWGLSTLGAKIKKTLAAVIADLPSGQQPVLWHGALFHPELDPDRYRTFRVADPLDEARKRKLEHIPVPEIANAAEHVLQQAKSIGEDELAKETARLFGYTRTGKKVATVVAQAVEMLVSQDRATRSGNRVRVK